MDDILTYQIIETEMGPQISDSRLTVYDILNAHNQGKTRADIGLMYFLSSVQVDIAFDYIEKHRDKLQSELEKLLKVAAQQEADYRNLAQERRSRQVHMTPERKAFYAKLEQIRQCQKLEAMNNAIYS